jgi:dTDP-glucose 4,6-dehydratase
METIFVTGGAGFIGSNFLNYAVTKYPDTRFVNIDKLTYAGNLDNLTIAALPNYVFERADICDGIVIERLFQTYTPTGIINFAAESNVDKSIESADAFITTNIGGTNNLLRLAVRYGVNRFHHISTDEVYGSLTMDAPAFTEEHTLAPNNPYSASKAGADLLVRSYHKTFGLDTVITRCSNNFGPNQDDTKLIPRFIKKLQAGENVPLYGDGSNRRDWLHVSDHVRAIDLVFHNGRAGEVYNVGSDHDFSNREVVDILLSLTGQTADAIEFVSDRLGHDFRYAINASKIEAELGWTPKVAFEAGLRALVNTNW